MPHDHANHLCTYHEADEATVAKAIDGALAAKAEWEAMPWNDRAAIFLKAADLVSGKYRYKLMAATMLGQGKNAWQAEIDAAAEVGFIYPASSFRPDLLMYMRLVERLFPIRCQVRRGALFPTTSEEQQGSMEVSFDDASCSTAVPYHPCSRTEYRALEGFVLAVSPFNFTAIGGNLPGSTYAMSLKFFSSFAHPCAL